MKQPASSPLEASYGRPAHASDDPHPPSPTTLRHEYDAGFALTADYQASLPDPVTAAEQAPAREEYVPIQQVGIAGFRLPLHYATQAVGVDPKRGAATEPGTNGHRQEGGLHAVTGTNQPSSGRGALALETRVSGTVSLPAGQRAINMSRIIRTFYEFEGEVFSLDTLPRVLERFVETVGSPSARLRLDFSFPMLQQSLRSGLAGYQYYDCAFEAQLVRGEGSGAKGQKLRRWMRLDFVYSSACPCSSELAEHARSSRGVFAVPHSQRSRARVWVEVAEGAHLNVEDVQAACLRALQTETQVMVRRPDEQAFAELNGAHVKFVEDAARLLHQEFAADGRVRDFQVICSHLESLHSHDAVAVICKGVPGGFRGDFTGFDELVC